jgi:hypothetical protein
MPVPIELIPPIPPIPPPPPPPQVAELRGKVDHDEQESCEPKQEWFHTVIVALSTELGSSRETKFSQFRAEDALVKIGFVS